MGVGVVEGVVDGFTLACFLTVVVLLLLSFVGEVFIVGVEGLLLCL